MIKDFQTYINEGLFDRNQSEFVIKKTDKGIEQIYIPKIKEELYYYIEIDNELLDIVIPEEKLETVKMLI